MKVIAVLLFLLMAGAARAQTPDCKKIRTGTFQTVVQPGSPLKPTLIHREKDRQTETQDSVMVEMKITWTSDCTYELSNTKVVRGSLPDVKPSQVMYITVLDVKEDAFTVQATTNFAPGYKAIFFYRILP